MDEETQALFEELLKADNQADRSVHLDKLREQYGSLTKQHEQLSADNAKLQEDRIKLTDRNAELFLRTGQEPKQSKNSESQPSMDNLSSWFE